MMKQIRCISGIARIMEAENVTAEEARELQEERAYREIDGLDTHGWELESVSGSPEQGIVLMFRKVDD